MKRYSRTAAIAVSILASVVLLTAAPADAAEKLKPAVIAIVDMDRVVNGCVAGKLALAELKTRADSIQTNTATLKSQFGTEEEALVKAQPDAKKTAEHTAWETQVRDFQARSQAANEGLQRQNNDFQATRQNVIKQINDAAQPIITDLMRETGATIVLAEGATLQHTTSSDITADVITRLDKVLPSVVLTAPTAAP